MEKKQRNYTLDLIRVIALFCVISVHFFLHSGYYTILMTGIRMYVMTVARTLFMVCVPFFITLTGYLMNKKTLSRRYYKGIKKTLWIYIIASACCIAYEVFISSRTHPSFGMMGSLQHYLVGNYGWYIEMYIGLFLLIPFLNLAYNGLPSRRAKQVLLLTTVLITILPSTTNLHMKILPNWWTVLYPVSYYYFGCYLREYGLRLKTSVALLSAFAATVLFGTLTFVISYGDTFVPGGYQDHGSLGVFIITVLLFTALTRLNLQKANKKVQAVLKFVSDMSLGAYLLSYIFDAVFYPLLLSTVPVRDRLFYYPLMVILVFLCSVALSFVINLTYSKTFPLVEKLVGKMVRRKQHTETPHLPPTTL